MVKYSLQPLTYNAYLYVKYYLLKLTIATSIISYIPVYLGIQ